MTMRQAFGIVLAALAFTAPAAAQDWAAPKCDLPAGHFLINSALLYLKNATETRFAEQKEKDLKDANRVLTQAFTTGGQDKNPAAWYYLGRYYILRNDAVGVDSAFTKAEALKPACKDDITSYRRNLWVPIFNKAVQALNAGKSDSALALLRQANGVYRAEPDAMTLMGSLFFNAGQYDSAALYFGKAQPLTLDPKFAKNRKDVTFNLAAAEQASHHYDSAAAVYRAYLTFAPNDAAALTQLANVFAADGKPDSARVLYTQMLAHADSIDPINLFAAGVAIYNGAGQPPDTAAQGTTCRENARKVRPALTAAQIKRRCDPETARTRATYDSVNGGMYRQAAQAFRAGLARNPSYRDALYNLTNVYFVTGQNDSMVATARRLYAVDPMNRTTIRLLAQAFQEVGKSDSTLHYITIADSLLPVEVNVGAFQPGDQNASVSGLFTNFHTVKSAPRKVTFEFLNGKNEVVSSQTSDIPALDPAANQPFQVQATGAGIVAWRYKSGS